MTREDCFGLLFIGYFVLIISLSVGVFAWGATGVAVLIIMALSVPFVTLLTLAIADAEEAARDAA